MEAGSSDRFGELTGDHWPITWWMHTLIIVLCSSQRDDTVDGLRVHCTCNHTPAADRSNKAEQSKTLTKGRLAGDFRPNPTALRRLPRSCMLHASYLSSMVFPAVKIMKDAPDQAGIHPPMSEQDQGPAA